MPVAEEERPLSLRLRTDGRGDYAVDLAAGKHVQPHSTVQPFRLVPNVPGNAEEKASFCTPPESVRMQRAWF
jgi:hypothetical protein